MTGPVLRLHPSTEIGVVVDDASPFGSPLTHRPDDRTRELFAAVLEHADRHGTGSLVADAPAMMRQVIEGPAFSSIADVGPGADSWMLHDDVLYPDPGAVRFSGLVLGGGPGPSVEAQVPDDDWPDVHELLASLSGRGLGEEERSQLTAAALRLADDLVAAGLAVPAEDTGVDRIGAAPPGLVEPGVSFLGHNLVAVRSTTTQVIADPYLLPPVPRHPSGYRPVGIGELGQIDAILLTHSHPDHLAPGSLLQFPSDTTIIVPGIERETILSVAMGDRLRQLGFTDVVELDWHGTHRVGDIEVVALPFLGEQPTDGPVLHPEIRNAGNTYLVRTPDLSLALLADAGSDHLGDSRGLAAEARARYGPVDVLFCGYRSWATYPVQLLRSSVARYLLFVPPGLWSSRMQLMSSVDDALDTAERWGARRLVPYADGGAPWFWDIGLGPRLDEERREVPGFDPFPERVATAAADRVRLRDGTSLASPVEVTLLRPNDSLIGWGSTGGPRIERLPGNAWPYGGTG